jgi:hypothetical protein
MKSAGSRVRSGLGVFLIAVATCAQACLQWNPGDIACTNDSNCLAGWQCNRSSTTESIGKCVPASDAGETDAGLASDGGMPRDGGNPDASMDAGTDAGSVTLPPSNLTYATNPAIYTRGVPIAGDRPSNSGGVVSSYAVAPALPGGLALDAASGVISGTPSVVAAPADYTVTATNAAGSTTASLSITVNDVAPSGLTYSANPVVYTKGLTIPDNTPSASGGVILSYAITPALPGGLVFSTATGIVSGTPTAVSAATNYTVTATNSGGSTTVALRITVKDIAPSALTYSTNPAVYTRGLPITNDTPSNSGGTVTSYTTTPPLPSGLSLDGATGIVSGTPAVVSSTTSYLVTASNSGGLTTAVLSITVNDAPPADLRYATNPAIFTKNLMIANDAPSNSGGTVITYGVTPTLPAGLSLDATTGVLSGTPTKVSAPASYTVTATNSGGSTTSSLSITVNDIAPSSLTYSMNPAVYARGLPITNNLPSSGGGPITSFAIAPPLPGGLLLNAGTGIISGTPAVLSSPASYTVTATNSGGSTTAQLVVSVVDSVPQSLSYRTNPLVCTKGTPIVNDTPSSSGGPITSYAITPALPSGLMLDAATGILSGTPLVVAAEANYTITGSNTAGIAHVLLVLTVNDLPPTNLTYTSNPATYTVGQAITPNTPSTNGGTVVQYAISPPLSAGLALDATTGIVSGTPTAVAPPTSYVVTATNSGGSTTGTLVIVVNDVPPTDLTYSSNPAIYTNGVAISENVPANEGGAVTLYAVSPALPPGLSFDVVSGTISGTPSGISPEAAYTVTAANTGGSTQATLLLTVNDVAPSSLTYSTNPAVYTKGHVIANNTPSTSGGAVVAYAISPPLPTGLSLNTTTGVLSGTPTTLSPAEGYTVTATNSGGSTETTLTITVNDVPPAGLSYAVNPAVYTLGLPITNTPSTTSGGAVASYAITPALPAGLSFSTATGVLSGTPTALSPLTHYTVTATNTGGSTSVTLTLTVNAVAPSTLTYAANPAVYSFEVPIANNVPSSSGGAVVSYSITPALPAGLSFSTTTGILSGTPTTMSAQNTLFTVTATNSGGSTSATLTLLVQSTTGSTGVVAVGSVHSCALVNGGVQCWGDNQAGQLGNNSTISSSVPVQVSVLTGGVQAIAAGGNHTCALVNGGVLCWGDNFAGDLGNNSTIESSVPVQVTGLTAGVQAITVGPDGDHTCALVNGGVQCWGSNSSGQLGDGSTANSSIPVLVSGLTSGVEVIVAGDTHTCAIVNGGVQCWGNNGSGQLGNNATANSLVPVPVSGLSSGAQALATSDDHTCALVNGGVECWGSNSSIGELGNNSTANSLVPVPVTGLANGVQGIAGGFVHTCALVNGGVQCWGSNSLSQLGANAGAFSGVPVPVPGLTGGVEALAAGGNHACALVNGGAQCWGSNRAGELGNGSTITSATPVPVNGVGGGVQSVAVAMGGSHACAVVNGGAQCWGDNTSGDLGNNLTTESRIPVQVLGLTSGVQAITGGTDHTCAVVNGGVQCWGNNGSGQLGNNSSVTSLVPVQVPGLQSGVQAIGAGNCYTCALVNGGVQCWGCNPNPGASTLGNNSTAQSNVPVQVSGLTSGVQAISVSWDQACALVGGGAKCWGWNSEGQVGNNTTVNTLVPAQVWGLTSGVQALAAEWDQTCAIVNGGAQCWGWNNSGRLGNNSSVQSNVPVQVAGLTGGVQAISGGYIHTCALVNGGVQCWGDNSQGELGNSLNIGASSVPLQVPGLTTGVQALCSGGADNSPVDDETCAFANGTAMCWGNNSWGQLGDGSGSSSYLPALIGPWAL